MEFPLWHNGIGDVLGTLECRFDPQPGTVALLQLWLRSQWHITSDPWLVNSVSGGEAKKRKQNKTKLIKLQGEMDESIIILGDFNTLYQKWTDPAVENQQGHNRPQQHHQLETLSQCIHVSNHHV